METGNRASVTRDVSVVRAQYSIPIRHGGTQDKSSLTGVDSGPAVFTLECQRI